MSLSKKKYLLLQAILLALIIVISAFRVIPITTAANSVHVIDSLPYVINEPGIYVLEHDLTSTGDGIIVNSSNVVIDGNGYSIKGNGLGIGIIIDSATYNVNFNVTVKNIKIRDFNTGIYVEVYSDNFTNVIVDNVVVKNATEHGIHVENTYYNVIIRNTVIENGEDTECGIYVRSTDGAIIDNVTIIGTNSSDYGICLRSGFGVSIRNSRIENTGLDGIYIYRYSSYCSVINTIVTSSYGDGIKVYTASHILLYSVNSSNNFLDGVEVNDSSRTYIVNSIIEHNGAYGVRIVNSYRVYLYGNIIARNGLEESSGAGGILIGAGVRYAYVIGNQILYNYGTGAYGYGVEAHTAYSFNVSNNVFAGNQRSPQAYDERGVGVWDRNYWSDWTGGTYDFDFNSDPNPLSEPLPELFITKIVAPKTIRYGQKVNVGVMVANRGYGDARDAPITLYWGEVLGFKKISFTWIEVNPREADAVDYGDVVADYGNYSLWNEDDGYFVYKLPWSIEVYGFKYNYMAVSTNGYVELLTSSESVLEGEYSVHCYNLHRTYEGKEGYGMGATVIFAYSGDLSTEMDGGEGSVSVFNFGDKLVVFFNGTTYGDWSVEYPVQYEIIIYRNGTIVISLGVLKYTMLDDDGFTGIYIQPLGLEVGVGFMLSPYASYKIDTVLRKIGTKYVDVGGESEVYVTFLWDTGMLPHTSPFTLWASANLEGVVSETAPYSILGVPFTLQVLPAPPVVGGKIIVTDTYRDNTWIILVISLALIVVTLALTREVSKYITK